MCKASVVGHRVEGFWGRDLLGHRHVLATGTDHLENSQTESCTDRITWIILKLRAVPIGSVLKLRKTTLHKCGVVPRRARM